MKESIMKRLGFILLSSVLLLTACANQQEKATDTSDSSKVTSLSPDNQELLDKATAYYKQYIQEQIDKLLTDTEGFVKLLKEGKLEEAKKIYPLVRMSYERSEPIAETFGESDVKIDFRLADYLDENNTEEGWSGFHRIEKILWEENTTKGTEKYGDQLINDIKELKAKIATVDVDHKVMLTGAVDLLNEVATSKITGEEEVYSHTDLYDFRANIEGAEKIFQLFKPLLAKTDTALVKELETDFQSVNSLLDKYMIDKEHYKPYTELTKEDTKELSEAVTKLGEPLSQMGTFLDGE